MKEKLTHFFKNFFSNDNGNSDDTETKQKRKILFLGVAILVILVFVFLIFSGNSNSETNAINDKNIGNFVLTDKDENVRTNWIGSAAEDLELSKKKIDSLSITNQRLNTELETLKKTVGNLVTNKEKKEKESQSSNIETPKNVTLNGIELPDLGNVNLYKDFPKPNESNNFGLEKTGEVPPIQETYEERTRALENPLVFNNHAQRTIQEVKEEAKEKHYIPTGSFVKVVLLNGVDAPTMTQAKTNPLPVLMRVVDTSVLPNSWQYDIKDCFITGEGYGDLTSERAYIRTNTLSCMANDGRHINLDFKGAVSGEDGKIGLKGRVVTKQGALLARTLIAGFLQGVGESFGQQDTTTIVSGSGTTTVPLDQTANEAFQQGLFQGLSDSAEKLADFYLKMADQISPVIEISAGREITVITTDLTEIKSIEEEAKKSTQIILNNQIQKDKR